MLFRLRSRHKLFSNCDYTLVFSFSLVRGGSAEVVLLEINHLSGLKAWLVSLSIIVENLETFENGLRSHRRSSYPTNLEGIIKRNNKAINYSLLPPSKISLLLTPCFTVHHFKIRARPFLIFWKAFLLSSRGVWSWTRAIPSIVRNYERVLGGKDDGGGFLLRSGLDRVRTINATRGGEKAYTHAAE